MSMEKESNIPIIKQEQKKEIPHSWFSLSHGPHGISASFSSEFAKLGKGNIIRHMLEGNDEEVKKATGDIGIRELKNEREAMARKYKNNGEKVGEQV